MQKSSQVIQHRLRIIQQSTGLAENHAKHMKCDKQRNMHAEHFSGNNDILLIIPE